jgi:hypothetical protein
MTPMSHEVLREMLARSKKSNTEGVMLTREDVGDLLGEFQYAIAFLDSDPRTARDAWRRLLIRWSR